MIPQYAPQIRAHLAESRKQGRTFDAAWTAAIKAHPAPKPSDHSTGGWPMDFMRDAMRAGYYRLAGFTGGGAIAEAA